MRAIAKAMGFAPEVWFEDALAEGRSIGEAEDSRGVAGRLEHLFEVVRNPKTGEPYTNAEVARMTLGDLPEENVERIRSGVYSVRALQPEGHMIGEWPRFSTGMWRKLDTIGVEKIASQLAAVVSRGRDPGEGAQVPPRRGEPVVDGADRTRDPRAHQRRRAPEPTPATQADGADPAEGEAP